MRATVMSHLQPGDEGMSSADGVHPMEDPNPGAPAKALSGAEPAASPATARRLQW